MVRMSSLLSQTARDPRERVLRGEPIACRELTIVLVTT